MSILNWIGDLFDSGAKIIDELHTSDEEKSDAKRKLLEVKNSTMLQLQEIELRREAEFNSRIKELEGTAKDLKSVRILGPIVIFLRGAFRPLFSYGLAYIDVMVFSGRWKLQDETITSAFWLINLIILIFYFGERAFQNAAPLLEKFLKK